MLRCVAPTQRALLASCAFRIARAGPAMYPQPQSTRSIWGSLRLRLRARSGTKSQRAFLQISSEYICKFSYPQGRKPPIRLLNTSGDFRKGVDLCESAGCTIRFRSGWSWSPTINARAPQNGSQEHVLHIHGGVPGRCRGTPGRCQRQQRRRQRQNQHAAGSAHSARTRQRR